jgi:hypothetical protein
MSELALRPAPSPSARMPPTACERLEAGSRSHWLRLRGRCRTSVGVVHRLAVASPTVFLLAGLSPLPSERIRPRDGRLSIMTSIKRDVAARGREEVARGSACRRLSPAIDARRRLSGQRSAARNSARVIGPRDPRSEYLKHLHD